MYYVGIDIGSTASKTVVTGDKEMKFVLPTGWSSKETASEIASRLLDEGIDVKGEEVRVAATGYGRVAVDYADFVITEITCHGRGGREMAGNDCAIIDVGGQDTKVILVEQGMIQDFLMNDKCSAGTGKFLEIMANRLGVTIEELFELASQGNAVSISSLCTVFAESEVISLIGKGTSREDIAYGVVESVAVKVAQLISQLGGNHYFLTGGLCEDEYVISRLSHALNAPVESMPLARYAGAIGAALLSGE